MHILMMPDYRSDNPYQTLLAEALTSQGSTVQFPQGYRRVFPLWRALKQSEIPFEVLHLHWINPYLKGKTFWVRLVYSIKFLIDVWLVKIAGIRIIWTVHNLIAHEALFPKLELWVQRQLVQQIDNVIVHHKTAHNTVVQLYGVASEKVKVIPHGHYRTVYGPAIDKSSARQQLGLSLQKKVYLNFGMLRPYKGIETLLEVWREGQLFLRQTTLLIAGKPKDTAYEQIIREMVTNIDTVILHLKYIEDRDIPLYFSAADVVVLPFNNLLTSGSLLLAMSYGKPIIAPRLSGIPETLANAETLLYSPDENLGLLHSLKKSLELDLSVLEQQVTVACDKLSWVDIGKSTYQVYQSSNILPTLP